MDETMILLLFLLLIVYWLTPILLFIIGIVKLKSKPKTAKILFIVAAVMLVVGFGVCGAMLS
ncbi:MAG: hypothetical protein VXW38_17800 [Bacteroidota bacterium]|nr:hypothetical protein [Bacteroidota bacterium]